MWEHEKSWISLILGIILLVFGVLPLLSYFKLIPFGLPSFLDTLAPTVLLYIAAAGGVYLIVDVFGEWGEWYGYVSLVLGVIMILAGLIPILNLFGVIAWNIPLLDPIIYRIVFIIESFFLIIGAFLQ